jgi:hypothetical protein
MADGIDGIFVGRRDWQRFQADDWLQTARKAVADSWLAETQANLGSMVADAWRDHFQNNVLPSLPGMDDLLNPKPIEPPKLAPAIGTVDSSALEPIPNAPASGGPPMEPIPSPDLSNPPRQEPLVPVTAPIVDPNAQQQPSNLPGSTQTTAGLSGGGDLAGRVGARGVQIMHSAADAASWLGDQGQKALQAVLRTEGGLAGARGDQGKSAGPLQFYEGGQLANFAQQHGLTLDQAKQYVEAYPEEAVAWAIGTPDRPGYLGAAIANGLSKGLTGAELATYAQRTGQVSVSPERAGQNFQALFGSGGDLLGQAGQAVANVASGAGQAIGGAAEQAAKFVENLVPNQFGGPSLTTDEAYAACGPAAAIAFARANGRNPTLREAVDLAKQVGWTTAGGMNGIANEKALLDKMGIAATLDLNPSWDKIAADASSGNPVAISTPKHYFVADGYDPQTGKYHVGASGTAFKAGAEWMTAEQIANLGGGVNGALFADHPASPQPSVAVADQQAQAPVNRALGQLGGGLLGRSASAVTNAGAGGQTPEQIAAANPPAPQEAQQPQQSIWDKLGSGISDVFKSVFGAGSSTPPPAPEGSEYGAVPAGGVNPLQDATAGIQSPQTGNPVLDALGTGASALGTAAHAVSLPFSGASPEFPTGGPLAGPGVGMARQVAGFEQLARENPEYALLKAERDSLLAQQPANAAAAGGADVMARAQQIRDLEDRMRQIASQTAIAAAAQRNPNIAAYETQGALEQGAAATALAPAGLGSGLARAAGSTLLDPGSAPFLGVQGAGEALNAAGKLVSNVAEDVTRSGAGAPAQATARFAADLGGAAAGGVAGYESAPEGASPLEVGARTAAGAALGAGLVHAAPATVGYVRQFAAPALDAPDAVQSLLNAYDGAVRVGAAQADTLLRQGTVPAPVAQQMA